MPPVRHVYDFWDWQRAGSKHKARNSGLITLKPGILAVLR